MTKLSKKQLPSLDVKDLTDFSNILQKSEVIFQPGFVYDTYTKPQIESLLNGIYLCHKDGTDRYHKVTDALILKLREKAYYTETVWKWSAISQSESIWSSDNRLCVNMNRGQGNSIGRLRLTFRTLPVNVSAVYYTSTSLGEWYSASLKFSGKPDCVIAGGTSSLGGNNNNDTATTPRSGVPFTIPSFASGNRTGSISAALSRSPGYSKGHSVLYVNFDNEDYVVLFDTLRSDNTNNTMLGYMFVSIEKMIDKTSPVTAYKELVKNLA